MTYTRNNRTSKHLKKSIKKHRTRKHGIRKHRTRKSNSKGGNPLAQLIEAGKQQGNTLINTGKEKGNTLKSNILNSHYGKKATNVMGVLYTTEDHVNNTKSKVDKLQTQKTKLTNDLNKKQMTDKKAHDAKIAVIDAKLVQANAAHNEAVQAHNAVAKAPAAVAPVAKARAAVAKAPPAKAPPFNRP